MKSFWKMMGVNLAYTAFLILLGAALIWGLFLLLRQDAFVHYVSDEFDYIEVSANATRPQINGDSFTVEFQNLWNFEDIYLEIHTRSLVIDGMELASSTSPFFLTLTPDTEQLQWRTKRLDFKLYDLGKPSINVESFGSTVHSLGGPRAVITTNNLLVSVLG